MTSTIWLAYAEEHALTDPDRRIAGRQRRLRRAPEAVLPEPADVLGWLANQRASYRKLADARGRAFNALVDDRDRVTNRLAMAGASVYSTVRLSAMVTVDLCVEAFASESCVSPHGHQFVKNPRREWRCTKCGQPM